MIVFVSFLKDIVNAQLNKRKSNKDKASKIVKTPIFDVIQKKLIIYISYG